MRLFRGARERGSQEAGAGDPALPDGTHAVSDQADGAGADGADDPPPRGRRRNRRLLQAAAVAGGLIAVFVVGWLGSALWFSPAPLLPEERTVPRLVELRLEDAEAALARAELRGRVADQRAHPGAARGVVIWQDPAPGTAVPMNTAVQLTTSTGPASVPVPDITGFIVRDAATILDAVGLSIGEIDTVASPGEPGVVLGTRPSAGTGRRPGSAVGLIVTAGDPPMERDLP